MSDPFSEFPKAIPGAQGVMYRRATGYAVHGKSDSGIAVHVNQDDPMPAGTLTPIYSLGPGSAPAVPTGRLFVRFEEGTRAESRRAEIEAAGCEIVEVPGYAPHAAWVRAQSGDIAEGLSMVHTLAAMPGVENVEPQMLMDSAPRQ